MTPSPFSAASGFLAPLSRLIGALPPFVALLLTLALLVALLIVAAQWWSYTTESDLRHARDWAPILPMRQASRDSWLARQARLAYLAEQSAARRHEHERAERQRHVRSRRRGW